MPATASSWSRSLLRFAFEQVVEGVGPSVVDALNGADLGLVFLPRREVASPLELERPSFVRWEHARRDDVERVVVIPPSGAGVPGLLGLDPGVAVLVDPA